MNPAELMDALSDREKLYKAVPVQKVEALFDEDNRGILVNDEFMIADRGTHDDTAKAFSQFCARLEVPASFLKKTRPDLGADIVKRLAPFLKKTALVVRGSDVVFAYKERIPYTKPTELGSKILGAFADYDHMTLEETPSDFKIGFHSNALVVEPKVGDTVKSGVNLRFSDFGITPAEIEAASYRLVCTNGAVYPNFRSKFSINAKLYDDMMNSIVRGVGAAREIFEKIIAPKMVHSATVNIDPMQAIRRTAAQFRLDAKELDRVMAAYAVEPMATMWGVSNAFTRAANDFRGGNAYGRLQRIGGNLVDVADKPHCTTCAATM